MPPPRRLRPASLRPTTKAFGGTRGAESKSGSGIKLTHQCENIFAACFTCDADSAPLWLSVMGAKRSAGVYSGDLIRTAGLAFSVDSFDPTAVARTTVGTATFTFANDYAATFAYTVNGVAQEKAITRQLFVPPVGTLCKQGGVGVSSSYPGDPTDNLARPHLFIS